MLGSTPPGLDVLFDRFFCDDVDIRSIAAYGIVRAGERALPRLLSHLNDADPDQQVRIIDVIGDIGPRAVDAVQATVCRPRPTIARVATTAAGIRNARWCFSESGETSSMPSR